MSQQLEFKFFWPLTEQNNLELDFAPCIKYEQDRLAEAARTSIGFSTGTTMLSGGTGLTAATWAVADPTYQQFQVLPDGAVGVWQVTPNMSVGRKTKPNFLHRFFTKMLLGWKWKDNIIKGK